MTICVAAIGGNGLVFGACDRMKTGGDIEFEPRRHDPVATDLVPWTSGSKIFRPTISLAAMTSGDASLQIEILEDVYTAISARVRTEPSNWWTVKDFAELYVKFYDAAKAKRVRSAVLSPVQLDADSFIRMQASMHPEFVKKITEDLTYFPMPKIATIFMGVDNFGTHIYVADNVNSASRCDLSSQDTIGFAAVGSGSRHAASLFMLMGHHRTVSTAETLFLTYLAKKRAQVAPGVGKDTDLIAIGPGLGQSALVNREVLNEIDKIYQSHLASEKRIMNTAIKKAEEFEQRLVASRQSQTPPPTSPPPKSPDA